jgi:hypothetical protein
VKHFCVLLGLSVVALLSGCSSIINGRVQTVTINSNVKDAEILVNGAVVGRTPFTGLLKRGSGTTVTVQKEGYESKTATLVTSVEPWFWGNIVLGGLLGSTTDAANGNMYKYSPATIEIDLEPVAGGK